MEMDRRTSRLVRSGMSRAVEAYHKLGNGCKTDLDPAIKEAFDLLDLAILDLKESLGFKRDGDWNKAEPPKAGAELAAKRRTESKACQECGQDFQGIKKAKYCSNACRQRAKYRRSKSDS